MDKCVSIGDSEFEREALLAAMRSRPESQLHTCRTKIVKFRREPSASGLERQVRQVTSEPQQFTEHDGGVDLKLDSHGFLPRERRAPMRAHRSSFSATAQNGRCSKRTMQRAYFPGSQRRIKPGRLGRRKRVGCPQLFRSSWPDRAQPHAIAPEPTSPTRTRSDVVGLVGRVESFETQELFIRVHVEVPTFWIFSHQFPPEVSFKFHARVFMLVLTGGPRFSF